MAPADAVISAVKGKPDPACKVKVMGARQQGVCCQPVINGCRLKSISRKARHAATLQHKAGKMAISSPFSLGN